MHAKHWLWQIVAAATLLVGCATAPAPQGTPASARAPVGAVKIAAESRAADAAPAAGAPAGASNPGTQVVQAGCLATAPGIPAAAKRVTVARVVDGDTIQLADSTKVRLIGINTPESVDPRRPVQAYGKEASAYTRQLVEGKEILLQLGRTPKDKYDRALAWTWLPDGRFINALLVHEGYAQVYTFADNPEYADLLLTCQRQAREAERGLWSVTEYQTGAEAAKQDRTVPTPASAPAPTVAPAPAPAPVATPATGVTITEQPGTVRRNGTASVAAKTAPGAGCSITVSYKSGPSKAQGLDPKQAGSDGSVGWSWKVGGNTTPGTWPVTIRCGDASARTAVTVP